MIDEPLARGTSLLHVLDPRGKLLACLALSLVAALAGTMAAPLVVLAVGAGLTILSRPPWRVLLARLCTVNAFVVFLWLTLPLTAPGAPWLRLWGLDVTREGVVLAGLITLKTNAIFLCVLSLVATTPAPGPGQVHGRIGRAGQVLLSFPFHLPLSARHRRGIRPVGYGGQAARVRCGHPAGTPTAPFPPWWPWSWSKVTTAPRGSIRPCCCVALPERFRP